MRFSRTDAGMENMALFYGVDFIVYTEGGRRSLSIEMVEQGDYNRQAIDIGYWSGVFEKYGFDKRLQFRAVGSRTALDFVAAKVCSGSVKNIIVVKDRDLDPYLGVSYASPFVVQSYGYSWENDVWSADIVLEILRHHNKSGGLDAVLVKEINEAFESFWRQVARLVFLEIGLRSLSQTIIPKSGEQLIEVRGGRLPEVKIKKMRELVSSKRGQIARRTVFPVKRAQVDVSRDCYGKLLQAFCYRVLEVAGKKSGAFSTISIDIANSIALSTYRLSGFYERCPLRHGHYLDAFERLKSAA